jgi:hypothetical protein
MPENNQNVEILDESNMADICYRNVDILKLKFKKARALLEEDEITLTLRTDNTENPLKDDASLDAFLAGIEKGKSRESEFIATKVGQLNESIYFSISHNNDGTYEAYISTETITE